MRIYAKPPTVLGRAKPSWMECRKGKSHLARRRWWRIRLRRRHSSAVVRAVLRQKLGDSEDQKDKTETTK